MSFTVLLSIGLLIVIAKLLEGVLRRFRLNAIVAYTAAGVALGPVLGVIEPTDELEVLLGIGIFLFFFLIGLDEIDISGFIATIRGRFFVAATLSVIISLLLALTVTTDLILRFRAWPRLYRGARAIRNSLPLQSRPCEQSLG